MTIKLVRRGRRFECFECGTEYIAPFTLKKCMRCDESEEFYRMK